MGRFARSKGFLAVGRVPSGLGRYLRLASPVVGAAFFAVALWALQQALSAYRYQELVDAMAALPVRRLAEALVLMVGGYLVLIAYDFLAFRFNGIAMPLRGMATGSLISNALGNNLGNILMTGAAVRYWIYTAFGLSAIQVTRVVVFCSLGFWAGYLALTAGSLAFVPLALPSQLAGVEALARPLGMTVLAILIVGAAYGVGGKALRLGSWRLRLPSPVYIVGLLLVTALDLGLMGAVLYVLLPPAAQLSYTGFLPLFLMALMTGTLSQVPGGLGVFETAMMLLLAPRVDARHLSAALLAFRGIYFILPLFLAVAFVGLRQALERRAGIKVFLEKGERWLAVLAPQVMAAACFASGALLLVSGALPAASGRLALVHRLVALPVIEASSLMAGLVGAALLLLARGLQRRLDAAWLLAIVFLAAGSLLSLLKGWDFEEALALAVACLALLPFHRQFYRRSSLLGEPWTPAWVSSIAIVLIGAAWFLWLNYAESDSGISLWWQFALQDETSRSLRATGAAVGLTVLFALQRLVRPMRPPPLLADDRALERVRPLVEASPLTYANLALRGDKALLFSKAGDAFLMYGHQGRSWIAMGDPVGTEEGMREVAWRFRDLADRFDGWCAFFEVRPERRDLYADLGLGLTLLGEEARVDLTTFRLEAPECRSLRQARARLLRHGYGFRVVERQGVPAILPALAAVSEAWLAGKPTREKGFSNASFDTAYLSNFPVAVVCRQGEIVAFANLWLGAGKEELSIDLMRYVPGSCNGTMDFLFSELLLWGRDRGFRWFNFGMAPLAGLDRHSGHSVWRRVGGLVYRYGEPFYHFNGLRYYKAKFNPVWTPLYLASPGGLALPQILVDVAALMAGGSVGGIISKKSVFSRRFPSPVQ